MEWESRQPPFLILYKLSAKHKNETIDNNSLRLIILKTCFISHLGYFKLELHFKLSGRRSQRNNQFTVCPMINIRTKRETLAQKTIFLYFQSAKFVIIGLLLWLRYYYYDYVNPERMLLFGFCIYRKVIFCSFLLFRLNSEMQGH